VTQPLPHHALAATIAKSTLPEILQQLATLPPDANMAEIRLDFLWPDVPDGEAATDALLAIVEAAQVPLIATLRPPRQGGRFAGPENVRLGLLQAALQAGFAMADAELDALQLTPVAEPLRQHGSFAASHHVFGEMPCRSDGLRWLQAMQDFSPQWDKLAVPVGAFNDVLRALEFCRAHAERGGRPALAPMGHDATATRALLAFTGNRATYGAPAPQAGVVGQPNLHDIVALWTHWGLDEGDLAHLASKPQPWLAVLGAPIRHSLSPAMHNAALKAAGKPERFAALDVPASTAALRLALHVAPRLGVRGLSITAPHKVAAAQMTRGDPLVQDSGAANCVRFNGDQAEATNTDVTALLRLLSDHVTADTYATILGAGGGARAAATALRRLGAQVRVACRDPSKMELAKGLASSVVAWEQRVAGSESIFINATPVGRDSGSPSPLPASSLARRPLIVEMAYGSTPTHLETDAKKAGCTVISGRQLLLEQGIDAYRFWFNEQPDRKSMQHALGDGPWMA
jgi:shikimate dehydrogenase/3-dehydroquinate dehydratase type I